MTGFSSTSPTFFQAVIDVPVMIQRQSCLLHVFSHWGRTRGGGLEGQAMVGVQHYQLRMEFNYLVNIELVVSETLLFVSPRFRQKDESLTC